MSQNTALGTPPAEVDTSLELVRALLLRQFPTYAELPLEAFAHGWDNAMFRLGPELGIRLPRRASAAELVVREATYLPVLAPQLNLPIPTPLHCGQADLTYPHPWLIVPWFSGSTANHCAPALDQAEVLLEFFHRLHRAEAPAFARPPQRSLVLAEKAAMIAQRVARIQQFATLEPGLLRLWQAAIESAPAPQSCWIHCDIHARNVLVAEGRFSAIVDWGDLTWGDPALDLGGIWSLFPQAEARHWLIQHYAGSAGDIPHNDPQLWLRAMGWAFYVGIVLVDTGRIDHPEHEAMGWDYLQRLWYDLQQWPELERWLEP